MNGVMADITRKNLEKKLYEQGLGIMEPEPSLDELIRWENDAGCYTPCGCWVEPDGHCDHGIPSWLIILGFIE